MTTIHGTINTPVELRTLKPGDWYTRRDAATFRDDCYPARLVSAHSSYSTLFSVVGSGGKEHTDYDTLLVHPLTRETLADGTTRWWYVGSVRPIGELPVGTEVRLISGTTDNVTWSDKDEAHDVFVDKTNPSYPSLIVLSTDDEYEWTSIQHHDMPVRVIRYPDPAAKGEGKGDGQTEFGRIITVESILEEHAKRLTALETAKAAAEQEPEHVTLGSLKPGDTFRYIKGTKAWVDNSMANPAGTRTVTDQLPDETGFRTVTNTRGLMPSSTLVEVISRAPGPAKPEPTYLERLPEALQEEVKSAVAFIAQREALARAIWESRDATFVAGEPVEKFHVRSSFDRRVCVMQDADPKVYIGEDGKGYSILKPDALAFFRRGAAIALAGKGGAQ